MIKILYIYKLYKKLEKFITRIVLSSIKIGIEMLADSTVTLSGSGNSSNSSQPSAAAIAAASAAIAALSPQSQASSSSLSISPVPNPHPTLPQSLQQFLLSPESISNIGIPGTGAVNTTNGPNSQAATAAAALMMNPAAYLAAPFLYGNNALR